MAVTIAAGPLNYVGLNPEDLLHHPQAQRLSSRSLLVARVLAARTTFRSVKISFYPNGPWLTAARTGAWPPRAGAGGSAGSCR